MWCSSIRSRLAVLGGTLLAACSLASSAALAQQRDEAWVISQILAGRFEELRALEKLSDEGVPFAMYWWGSLVQLCVFDRCDEVAGLEARCTRSQGGACPRSGIRLRPCRQIAGGDHRRTEADGRGRGAEGRLRATDARHPLGGRPTPPRRPKGACRLCCACHLGAEARAAGNAREPVAGRANEARRSAARRRCRALLFNDGPRDYSYRLRSVAECFGVFG